jgi:hypothetical protein
MQKAGKWPLPTHNNHCGLSKQTLPENCNRKAGQHWHLPNKKDLIHGFAFLPT